MASKFARECWKSGIPLNEAWRTFAPKDLKEQLANLPGFIDALDQGINRENPMSVFASFRDATQQSVTRRQIERQMKEEVLTDLLHGQLVATGYREAPSRSQAPVQIEASKFERDDPDWNSETFEVHGIRYGRIRISDPTALNHPDRSETRKGSVAAIELAIDQLIFANPNFCEIARKQACQMVRDYVGTIHKSGNGLSDQNISKVIVRKCGKKQIS